MMYYWNDTSYQMTTHLNALIRAQAHASWTYTNADKHSWMHACRGWTQNSLGPNACSVRIPVKFYLWTCICIKKQSICHTHFTPLSKCVTSIALLNTICQWKDKQLSKVLWQWCHTNPPDSWLICTRLYSNESRISQQEINSPYTLPSLLFPHPFYLFWKSLHDIFTSHHLHLLIGDPCTQHHIKGNNHVPDRTWWYVNLPWKVPWYKDHILRKVLWSS